MTKTCPVCKTEFESKHKLKKYCCRECYKQAEKERVKNWRANNPKKVREYETNWKKTCPVCETEFETKSKIKKYCCADCSKEAHNEKQKEWCANNPERKAQLKRTWKKNNRDKLNQYKRNKKHIDPNFKLADNIRNRVRLALKSQTAYKQSNLNEYLGCTIPEYKQYLESLFERGMNWANYGFYGWVIDHILPLSSFDLTDREQQLKAFNYKNTQPMWWYQNLSKGNKIL